MLQTHCPSCGAEMVFLSAITVYAVCKYCQTTVVRTDVDVQAIGKEALLPADMSPFQIGTTGVFRGSQFSIAGRIKMGWENGYWNEWFLHTDAGERGWLAEAQGTYAISFEHPITPELETLANKQRSFADHLKNAAANAEIWVSNDAAKSILHDYASVNGVLMRVVDIKQCECIGSEGELPLQLANGRQAISVDFLGPDGEFASMEIGEYSTRVFAGEYVTWRQMQCRFARQFDGWGGV